MANSQFTKSYLKLISNDNSTVMINAANNGILNVSNNSGQQIILSGLSQPTLSDHAVNKAYVDNLANGLTWKQSVQASSVGNNIDLSTLCDGVLLDGVTLKTHDRVLIFNQTNQQQNGIYIIGNLPGSIQRTNDMIANEQFISAAVFVDAGLLNANIGYVQTQSSATAGIDGSRINTWVRFSNVSITPGISLSSSANTFNLNYNSSQFGINGNNQLILTPLSSNGQNFTISGTSNCDSLITNTAVINTIQNVNGITVNNNVDFKGILQCQNNINVGASSNLLTIDSTNGNFSTSGTLTADGIATFTNGLLSNGNIVLGNNIIQMLLSNGNIQTTGNVICSTVQVTSDSNFKSDVKQLFIDDLQSKFSALNPVSFYWNNDIDKTNIQHGFIAQQVQHLFPQAINNNNGVLSINYNSLLVYLIMTVQQQTIDISNLQQQISLLQLQK